MRITLVAVPIMDTVDGCLIPIAMDRVKSCPPYGLYLLGQILKDAGYDVTIYDMICEGDIIERRLAEIAAESDVVGLSTTSLNWPTVAEVVKIIRRHSKCVRILLGGVHATTYYRHILANFPVDDIIRGEADRSITLYMEYVDGRRSFSDIPGLCSVVDGTLCQNHMSSPITSTEMASLPVPSYDVLPGGNYEALSVESSRGCRFNCSFCSTVSRGHWRALAPEQFIWRIKAMQAYVPKTLNPVYQIIDDCFTLDVDRAIEILRLWEEERLDYKATLDARVDNLKDDRLVQRLACILDQLLVGAECGYEEGLAQVRKGVTLQDIERSAQVVKAHGISQRCVYSFVIGFPWETIDECLRTVAYATELKHKYDVRVYLQWFSTIPGSRLWDQLRREGRVNISQYDSFGFFRNQNLFYAGVRLSPTEIDGISERIAAVNKLFLIAKRDNDVIQYADPLSMLDDPHAVPAFA